MVEDVFTQKEIETIKLIRNSIIHRGRTPSIRELMSDLGYKSPRSAQDLLESLESKGIIERQESGNYKLLTNPDLGPSHAQTVNVPIFGTVACGTPMLAEQNIEGFIPISTALAKTGRKYFILHAKGDSMDEVDINDGDLVLVRQQPTANNGDHVVALIDDEATIKEFFKDKNVILLKPRSTNKNHKPIILTKDFQIQGVVVTTIPKLE